MTVVWWFVGIGVTLAVAAVGIGLLLTALFVTGGPSTDLVCTDSVSGSERPVRSTVALSDELQARLDRLDDRLDAGSAGQVSLTESDATLARAAVRAGGGPADQRAGDLLPRQRRDRGPGAGRPRRARRRARHPRRLGEAEANATVDTSGGTIRVDLTNFSVGNVPGFATDLAEGPLEDLINEALADEGIEHVYSLGVQEIEAVLSGTP